MGRGLSTKQNLYKELHWVTTVLLTSENLDQCRWHSVGCIYWLQSSERWEVCSDKIMVLLLLLWMLHHVHTTLSPRPSKLRQVSPGSLSIPSNAVCTTASFGIHYTRGPQEMPILNDFHNQPVISVVMER